jgi:hypothetical protein
MAKVNGPMRSQASGFVSCRNGELSENPRAEQSVTTGHMTTENPGRVTRAVWAL